MKLIEITYCEASKIGRPQETHVDTNAERGHQSWGRFPAQNLQ